MAAASRLLLIRPISDIFYKGSSRLLASTVGVRSLTHTTGVRAYVVRVSVLSVCRFGVWFRVHIELPPFCLLRGAHAFFMHAGPEVCSAF